LYLAGADTRQRLWPISRANPAARLIDPFLDVAANRTPSGRRIQCGARGGIGRRSRHRAHGGHTGVLQLGL